MKPNLEYLIEKWPSAIVARKEISRFTGGVLTSRTMANLDSSGQGIPDRFLIGRKVCYFTKSVARFLEDRAHQIESIKDKPDPGFTDKL